MNLSFGRDGPAAALVLAAVVLIVPLWCVHSPAMPDYPAHLAGFYLIDGAAKTQPLASYYAIHWALIPNLASETIVPLLGTFLPMEAAAKLFLSAAVALWVLGPALIQRTLYGRVSATALAGAFFAYNANFTWGFFNYYFATGLCFVVFAAWMATARRRPPVLLAGFALAVLVLYVCHLVAVFLLGVLIACFEASQIWSTRDFDIRRLALRALRIGLVFLPAALAYLFLRPAGGLGGDVAFDYTDTIGDRLAAMVQSAYAVPAYLVIGGLALLWFWGLIYDKIRVHPAMKITVLVLAALTIVAPEWALGGWGVHLRLPGVFGALLFATAELRLAPRLAALVGGALLIALGVNAAMLEQSWRGYDRQYGEFRAALRDVPKGAKLLTVIDSDAMGAAPDQPYWHMAEFAIADRDAFTSLMFATPGQHVVTVRPPYRAFAAATAQQGSPPDISELNDLAAGRDNGDENIKDTFPYLKFFQCHYDEAVVVNGKGDPSDVPDFLALRHQGSFFAIYDLHRTQACKGR